MDEFPLDFTGNRRYWPVVVESQIPVEYLTREYMDLLLAEARDRYFAGERYDYGDEFEELAEQARARHLHDLIGDAIRGWIAVGEELRIAPAGETENEKAVRLGLALQHPLEALSVRFLIDSVEELSHIDPAKDKVSAEKVAAALDSHPSYRRGVGSKTISQNKAKVWWERIV